MQLLEWHRTLLSDVFGQEAFRRALFDVIQEGATVLDAGTGTGIHALFACQAGAKRVYAVESEPIISIAKEICRQNGLENRVQFIEAPMAEVTLPEQVDVIITNQSVNDCLSILASARHRFLKPNGRLIPYLIDVVCAPLQSSNAYKKVRSWEGSHFGFTFTACRHMASHGIYDWPITEDELLSDGALVASLDLATVKSSRLAGTAEMPIHRDGVLHGVGLWYVHHLATDVTVSSGPGCRLPTQVWPSYFLPIQDPFGVNQGDSVRLNLQISNTVLDPSFLWDVVIQRQNTVKGSFRQSTFFAMPISKKNLAKRSPNYTPRLNPTGVAARFVMDSCNGGESSADIQVKVAESFPELFIDKTTLERFVAKIIEEYSV